MWGHHERVVLRGALPQATGVGPPASPAMGGFPWSQRRLLHAPAPFGPQPASSRCAAEVGFGVLRCGTQWLTDTARVRNSHRFRDRTPTRVSNPPMIPFLWPRVIRPSARRSRTSRSTELSRLTGSPSASKSGRMPSAPPGRPRTRDLRTPPTQERRHKRPALAHLAVGQQLTEPSLPGRGCRLSMKSWPA